MGLDLLIEWMGLDLIDRGHEFVVDDQVHQPVRLEVADADGSDPAFPVQFLHRPPGAIDIAVGLVDQIQIQVIQLQPLY